MSRGHGSRSARSSSDDRREPAPTSPGSPRPPSNHRSPLSSDTIPFPPYTELELPDSGGRWHAPRPYSPPADPARDSDSGPHGPPRSAHTPFERSAAALASYRTPSRTPPPPYSEARVRALSTSPWPVMASPSASPRPPGRDAPDPRPSQRSSPPRRVSPPHRPPRLQNPYPPRAPYPPHHQRHCEPSPSPTYSSPTSPHAPDLPPLPPPQYSDVDEKHALPPIGTPTPGPGRPGDDADADVFFRDFGSPTTTTPSGKRGAPPIAYSFPHGRTPPRPLITYIRNEWRHAAARARADSDGSDGDGGGAFVPAACAAWVSSRAFRRWLVALLLLGLAGYLAWFRRYVPGLDHRRMVALSMRRRLAVGDAGAGTGWFGAHRPLALDGLSVLGRLDARLVPGSGQEEAPAGSHRRRLVIVGDVHGHAEELDALLARVRFDAARGDHLVTTGDAVARGPRSAAVLDTLLRLNASCVRGPHEDRVLLAHRDLHTPSHRARTSGSPTPTNAAGHDDLAHLPTLNPASDLALAATLAPRHLAYLAACPTILSLGNVTGLGAPVAVAHAGLVPFLPLARQDPGAAMTMRSLDLRAHVPSPRVAPPPDASAKIGARRWRDRSFQDELGRTVLVPWQEAWDAAQAEVRKKDRGVVVHGHGDGTAWEDVGGAGGSGGGWWGSLWPWGRSRRRWRYSWGLDGACADGGELRALVITAGRRRGGSVRTEVVRVPCRRAEALRDPVQNLGAH